MVAIGTITSVEMPAPSKSGKNRPGRVKFSDGIEVSTFDQALLSTADTGRGQLAEYVFTEKQNGQYTNRYLEAITLKGSAAPAQQQSVKAPTAAPQGIVDLDDVLMAIRSVAERMREQTAAIVGLTSQLVRSANPLYRIEAGKALAQVAEPEQPTVDPLNAVEEALAKAVNSPEAARAMIDAIKSKFTNKAGVLDAEKAVAQARKTLAAHGVEA